MFLALMSETRHHRRQLMKVVQGFLVELVMVVQGFSVERNGNFRSITMGSSHRGSCCSLAFWIASGLNSEGFPPILEYCCNIVGIQCYFTTIAVARSG